MPGPLRSRTPTRDPIPLTSGATAWATTSRAADGDYDDGPAAAPGAGLVGVAVDGKTLRLAAVVAVRIKRPSPRHGPGRRPMAKKRGRNIHGRCSSVSIRSKAARPTLDIVWRCHSSLLKRLPSRPTRRTESWRHRGDLVSPLIVDAVEAGRFQKLIQAQPYRNVVPTLAMPLPIATVQVLDVGRQLAVADTGGIDVHQVHVSPGTYQISRVRHDRLLPATLCARTCRIITTSTDPDAMPVTCASPTFTVTVCIVCRRERQPSAPLQPHPRPGLPRGPCRQGQRGQPGPGISRRGHSPRRPRRHLRPPRPRPAGPVPCAPPTAP